MQDACKKWLKKAATIHEKKLSHTMNWQYANKYMALSIKKYSLCQLQLDPPQGYSLLVIQPGHLLQTTLQHKQENHNSIHIVHNYTLPKKRYLKQIPLH